MMGTHHAITGAASWVAVTTAASSVPMVSTFGLIPWAATVPLIPTLGWFPMSPGLIIFYALLCAGGALWPDADHHSATIAHSLPVVGKAATAAIGAATGGHRHGTHSPLSAAIMALLVLILGRFDWASTTVGSVMAAVVAAATLAFAIKVLHFVKSWGVAWLIGIALAVAINLLSPGQWQWLPLCLAVGWVTHLGGDFLTTGGLPLTWPVKWRAPKWVTENPFLSHFWSVGGYFSFPILGNAGSWREWCLMIPTAGYALTGIALAAASLIPGVKF